MQSFGKFKIAFRTYSLELLLVYLFKSNVLESIHLNPLVGKNLDIAKPYKLFSSFKYLLLALLYQMYQKKLDQNEMTINFCFVIDIHFMNSFLISMFLRRQ